MIEDILLLWKLREKPVSFRRRIRVYAKRLILLSRTFRLLLGPSIMRFKGAKIGHVVVLGGSKITGSAKNLVIGNQTSLGLCEITLHDNVSIGDAVVINDGVILLTASHDIYAIDWPLKTAPITIGDYAWIATNALILPGVSIGTGAVVGAGAVVRGDIPDHGVVTGNPSELLLARRVKQLQYSPALLNAPYEAWVGKNVITRGRGVLL